MITLVLSGYSTVSVSWGLYQKAYS